MQTTAAEITEAPDYPHGVVRGRYLRAVVDTPADPGREMDWRPAEGKVTFTPVVPMRRAGVPVPALFTQQAVVCNLDPQGYLTDQAGERHVHLIAGQYKVRFDIRQFRVPGPRVIEVTPEHTVDNPLDLVLAMEEPPPPPGSVIVVDESTALRASRSAQEALAAADRAEDAAAQAETSATTVGDAASQAREAATSARDSATTAGAAAGQALESASDAQDVARATAAQVATATESATSAGAAADRAGSAETMATQAATRAESAATTATGSVTDAESAASRAATTADAAQQSAKSAEESAKSAEESATTTSGHVASTSAAASRAESAAESSENSAVRAGQSADTAASKAGDAETASTTATDAASRAAKSATQADASATSAAESATSATESATRAGSAADTLNADAREFGEAVRSGTFTGEPGPAPSIKIGAVTSGTTPSATITGESPDLTLDLVLAKGDQGDRGEIGPPGVVSSASSYVLVGPGRPDQPSTTAGAITGSEPVGAEYRSTDGANVGAFVWMKRPGGKWAVTDGDTGWRNVTSFVVDSAGAAAVSSGALRMRRVNDVIYASTVGQRLTMVGGLTSVRVNHPDGFAPAYTGEPWYWGAWDRTPLYALFSRTSDWWGNAAPMNPFGANLAPLTSHSWMTHNAWPSTLPGTPA